MGAMVEVIAYLVNTVMSVYLVIVLLRVLLQLARADFYNPICQFVVKVTDPLVRPLRRIVPGLGGLDLATLLLALIIQFVTINLLYIILAGVFPNAASALVWSVIGIIATIVKIYFFSILASIIFSWVAPGSQHPALALLHQLNEPVMAPVRKLLPSMGGLDLSPILVFIVINVLNIFLNHAAVATGMPRNLLLAI